MIVKVEKLEIVFDTGKSVIVSDSELQELKTYFEDKPTENDFRILKAHNNEITKKHGICRDYLLEIYDAFRTMNEMPMYGSAERLIEVVGKQIKEQTGYV